MQLSKKILAGLVNQPGLVVPDKRIFSLPEKVLQFGTGVLLRGLPDYFIDKANRSGVFNGRIVVVKSTSKGSTDEFAAQDNLYTLEVRGIEKGNTINESIINSSISRVLAASSDWTSVLECASNAEMQIIISNTTEVGIVFSEDNIFDSPPASFPGKLLAFLHARYIAFNGSKESGMVIIPTELIMDNGTRLKEIVTQLAQHNQLNPSFTQWMLEANHFCNSLVDRIVPGKLSTADQSKTQEKLGYKDELLIMAEPFRLWAIETGDNAVKAKLSFSKADDGVKIEPSIEKFRELKLRLLNGTHTFTCGLAILCGFRTVKDAMENESFSRFIQELMDEEISPALHNEKITEKETNEFARQVVDRFSNTYLDHQWSSIAVQFSSKMKMRNVPLLLKHYEKSSNVPERMATGFAAFILFMRPSSDKMNDGIAGTSLSKIEDDNASIFMDAWHRHPAEVVKEILANKDFWGADLSTLPGFNSAVELYLQSLIHKGALSLIQFTSKNKVEA